MSASLVGSEMCIRDRERQAQATPPSAMRAPVATSAPPLGPPQWGGGARGCLLYTSDAADDM
eukprot:15182028-Alexandrium_andersonii.AAC.1